MWSCIRSPPTLVPGMGKKEGVAEMRLYQTSKQGSTAFMIYRKLGRVFKTTDAAEVLGKGRVGPIMGSFRRAGIIQHNGAKTHGKKKATIPQQRWGPDRITIWEFTEPAIKRFEWWISREECGDKSLSMREFKKKVEA